MPRLLTNNLTPTVGGCQVAWSTPARASATSTAAVRAGCLTRASRDVQRRRGHQWGPRMRRAACRGDDFEHSVRYLYDRCRSHTRTSVPEAARELIRSYWAIAARQPRAAQTRGPDDDDALGRCRRSFRRRFRHATLSSVISGSRPAAARRWAAGRPEHQRRNCGPCVGQGQAATSFRSWAESADRRYGARSTRPGLRRQPDRHGKTRG